MILEIRRGQAKRLNRHVTKPVFLVGTGPQCDMVLGDNQFPVIHFYLLTRGAETIIRPICTQPELTVNGQPQQTALTVTSGDRIRTGPFEFLVKAA